MNIRNINPTYIAVENLRYVIAIRIIKDPNTGKETIEIKLKNPETNMETTWITLRPSKLPGDLQSISDYGFLLRNIEFNALYSYIEDNYSSFLRYEDVKTFGYNDKTDDYFGALRASNGELFTYDIAKTAPSYNGSDYELISAIKKCNSYSINNQIILMHGFMAPCISMFPELFANNPILGVIGSSSTGKTTMGNLLLSLGCNPEDENYSLSFGSTNNYILEKSGDNCGIPILVDDTSESSNLKTLEDFLYKLANGKGRGRVSVNRGISTERPKTIKTSIMVTSETSLIERLENGKSGLTGRYYELTIKAKDLFDDASGASDIRKTAHENYGFLLPSMMAELQRYGIDNFKADVECECESINNTYKDPEVICRWHAYFAVCKVLSKMLNSSFSLNFDSFGIIEKMRSDLFKQFKLQKESSLEYIVREDILPDILNSGLMHKTSYGNVIKVKDFIAILREYNSECSLKLDKKAVVKEMFNKGIFIEYASGKTNPQKTTPNIYSIGRCYILNNNLTESDALMVA